MISEGAEGMLQAVVLSFGGLQFTSNSKTLQFHTDPDILHNHIKFHSILYKNNTVDISIQMEEKDTVFAVTQLKGTARLSKRLKYVCLCVQCIHFEVVKYIPCALLRGG